MSKPNGRAITLVCGMVASAALAQSPTVTISKLPESQYIRATGKCMFAALDGTEGTMPPARLETCSNRNEMRWTISGDAKKGYRIHPRNRPDQCLDIDGKTIKKYSTRVVLWNCQERNAYQLWSFAPMTTTLYNGYWAVFNKGLLGTVAGEKRPKVLSVYDGGEQLYVVEFHSNNLQPSAFPQWWSSQEIWCYHGQQKHAGGLQTTSYSAGGHTVQSTVPKCE
jgi:hypothetical protein